MNVTKKLKTVTIPGDIISRQLNWLAAWKVACLNSGNPCSLWTSSCIMDTRSWFFPWQFVKASWFEVWQPPFDSFPRLTVSSTPANQLMFYHRSSAAQKRVQSLFFIIARQHRTLIRLNKFYFLWQLTSEQTWAKWKGIILEVPIPGCGVGAHRAKVCWTVPPPISAG